LTRLVLSPTAFQHLDRVTDFLLETDPVAAGDTTPLLISGLRVLRQHPLIGRPVERGYRELVISRGDTGYVALYKFDIKNDFVVVLTIRHQREAGYL
jgi:plasmid stabilization system protein ParE